MNDISVGGSVGKSFQIINEECFDTPVRWRMLPQKGELMQVYCLIK